MLTSRDLTAQQLRCFVAVAEEQQFTAAADLLNVAQPSISSQIHRLERVLGTPVFHRGHRPVLLTDAGLELLPLARRILTGFDDIFHTMSEVEGLRRGHVTIGATPSLSITLLPSILNTFHREHPEISLTFVERDSLEITEQLEAGALDLALVVMPVCPSTLHRTVLAIEKMVVMVAPDHPLAGRASVTLEDLRGVPMIMFAEGYEIRVTTLAAFERAGLTPNVALDGAEMGTIHPFVAAGLGAAVVPSIVAQGHDNVCAIPLDAPQLERTIGLVRPANHELSRAASALFSEITLRLAESGWPTRSSELRAP